MPPRHLVTALSFGLLLGFLFAAGPSCGPRVNSCSSSSCGGCCTADGLCVAAPNNSRASSCGNQGAACIDCGSRGCVDGACSNGTGGGSGSCSGMTCGGCCSGTSSASVCISVPSATNCGSGGGVCHTCGPGQACLSGACTATDGGAGEVGTVCGSDDDCAALGVGHRCKQKTSSGRSEYSGGYCTRDCRDGRDCPDTAICVGAVPGYGEADSVCWARCTSVDECRAGYDCYSTDKGVSACWISPLPAFDAGTPADKVGKACTSDALCQNPPDDGACLFEQLPDGGPGPFTGGYCSAPCIDSSHCSADGSAKCLAVGGGFGACVEGCPAPLMGRSSCRQGYVCRAIRASDGGVLPDGFCWPRCDNPGAACGLLTACAISGYCE